jgi:DNA-binding PadR family transcriptional regulator/polyisoprenoid-binding protein YceI
MATEQRVGGLSATEGVARFELAPPRRFMLPAILLLLSEQPGYGYGLAPRLVEFRFGHVDRPAVYRALAQLERDGLVQVSANDHQTGQARRVYSVTPLGERVLRVWMGVIREEHAHLGEVIRRYQATATIDSVLSEVEGGWVPDLDLAWSPVSTTSLWRRRLMPPDNDNDAASHLADLTGESLDSDRSDSSSALPGEFGAQSDAGLARPDGLPGTPTMGRFVLDPERSAVLIDARSTVGPICFGTTGVHGSLYAAMGDAGVSTEIPPTGWLTIDMTRLSSGNKLYDAELHRRINSRRFPTAKVELKECTPSAPGWRYRLRGELTFHGITRRTEGTVRIESASDDRIVISGEQAFDIRDFALPSPTMLMLRIFPDVRVRLYGEAERSDDD